MRTILTNIVRCKAKSVRWGEEEFAGNTGTELVHGFIPTPPRQCALSRSCGSFRQEDRTGGEHNLQSSQI